MVSILENLVLNVKKIPKNDVESCSVVFLLKGTLPDNAIMTSCFMVACRHDSPMRFVALMLTLDAGMDMLLDEWAAAPEFPATLRFERKLRSRRMVLRFVLDAELVLDFAECSRVDLIRLNCTPTDLDALTVARPPIKTRPPPSPSKFEFPGQSIIEEASNRGEE